MAHHLLLAGHNVAMPDLATHGFDRTEPGHVVDMAQYTMPARRLIEASSEKVILLGHSMGGASCTYLGEQVPDRIATLVYLTAFLAPAGKTPNDYITAPPFVTSPRTTELLQILAPTETGLRLNANDPALVKAAFYGDCSDHDIAIALHNNIPIQTFVPVVTPSATTPEKFGRLRRVFIECTEDKAIAIETQRQMQADSPGTEVVTMTTSHSPFFFGARGPGAHPRVDRRIVDDIPLRHARMAKGHALLTRDRVTPPWRGLLVLSVSASFVRSASVLLFFLQGRVEQLGGVGQAELDRPGLQHAVAGDLRNARSPGRSRSARHRRLRSSPKSSRSSSISAVIPCMAFAGLGAGGLADDLEDLGQPLDWTAPLLLMRQERLLQAGGLRRLGRLLESLNRLLLGEVDVFQCFVERVVERLFLRCHGGNLSCDRIGLIRATTTRRPAIRLTRFLIFSADARRR